MQSITIILLLGTGVFFILNIVGMFVFTAGIMLRSDSMLARMKRFCNVMLAGSVICLGLMLISLV